MRSNSVNVNATETKNVALKEWLAASKELEKYSSNPFCEEFKATQIRFDNAVKAYYANSVEIMLVEE